MTVTANREALTAALRHARPGLMRLEQDAAGMTPGAAYLARKRFHQLLSDLVTEECDGLERRIWDRASAAGAEITTAPRAEPRSPAGEITVARGALLVDRQRFIAIEQALDDLEMEHGSLGLTCEIRGPWPPYSFADTIEVT